MVSAVVSGFGGVLAEPPRHFLQGRYVMMPHALFRTAWMTLLLVGLCACGQSNSPDDPAGETEARSQRLSEIQALTESAREAYALLDGVWDAESVYTAPSGAEARLETVLTFERDGEEVAWTEAHDSAALLADLQAALDEQALVVLPKAELLISGFDEGFVYVNKLHLVFDELASFEAGAEGRKKAYDAIRDDEYDISDYLTALLYQPYVVKSVEPDRIVLQRPARVFPEAVEQALNADEDNPDQVGGRLELILTRRAQP